MLYIVSTGWLNPISCKLGMASRFKNDRDRRDLVSLSMILMKLSSYSLSSLSRSKTFMLMGQSGKSLFRNEPNCFVV